MTSHMTGFNRKRSGTVEVHGGSQQECQGHHGQAGVLEASSSDQKRKAGESDHEDEADRGREPDHAEEPEAKQSRGEDIATRRAELLRMFEDLCDRAGELNICIKRGKESHGGTRKDAARATESDSARGKIKMLFLSEGHPSPDEDIDMEVPDDNEEMAPMSSEPHEKPHQPATEEPIFYPREGFHKYNYAVNLSEMADLAEGGELHVGQLDLHTNPNGTLKEYHNMLDSFGGAKPSVIPQPGDAVCEGVQGFLCMTHTLPKGVHLEVMNMQNRDTSFSYWPYKDYTAFGSSIHHSDLILYIKSTGEDPTSSNRPKDGEPDSFLAMAEDG